MGLGIGLGEFIGRRADIDGAAGQKFSAPEIGGGRGIRLDVEIGCRVAGRMHAPDGVADPLHLRAEGFHGRCGEIDIALRADFLALENDIDRLVVAGGGHQKCGHILAGKVGVDRDAALREASTLTADGDGRAAGRRLRLNAEGAQGFHQRHDRAFAHMLVAIDDDGAIHKGGSGGEKAGGGAGIAEEKRLFRLMQPT